MVQFGSEMSSLQGSRKYTILNIDSKSYWNIFGRHKYPTLYLCAKEVNEMICSSAAPEQVWSNYRFIYTRLRNRFSNDKVDKLAFIHVSCAIFDKNDKTDYIMDDAAVLSGADFLDALDT